MATHPKSKRGELSLFGARGQGRKGRIEAFAVSQCSYIIGGKKEYRKIAYKIPRPGKTHYLRQIIKGGTRCKNEAVITKNRGGTTIRLCLDCATRAEQ